METGKVNNSVNLPLCECTFCAFRPISIKGKITSPNFRRGCLLLLYRFCTGIFAPSLKQNSIVPSAFMCALFKQTCGIPPKQYLQDIRMKKAMSLLVNTDLKIAEVALSVGYDCQLAFSGAFRKYTGVSPSEYRENKKCHTLV